MMQIMSTVRTARLWNGEGGVLKYRLKEKVDAVVMREETVRERIRLNKR